MILFVVVVVVVVLFLDSMTDVLCVICTVLKAFFLFDCEI